jgi:hypothetical protein
MVPGIVKVGGQRIKEQEYIGRIIDLGVKEFVMWYSSAIKCCMILERIFSL